MRSVLVAGLLAGVVLGGALALVSILSPPGTSVGQTAVLVGAGDIAGCEGGSDEATARLVDSIPGTVFTLGDNAYPDGSLEQLMTCYGPTWGRHLDRTRPAIGNHDYLTDAGLPYFDYFGDRAGPRSAGWYSYEAGAWHVVVLNSVCFDEPQLCPPGDAQVEWLQADLAAHPTTCLLAYWHAPRFSSGSEHGGAAEVQPLWEAVHAAGGELVLSGDDHHYERFQPLNANGAPDPAGLRQFIVGTGGGGLRPLGAVDPRSEFQLADIHGVLRLTLRPGDYDWAFIAEPDGQALDEGTARCA